MVSIYPADRIRNIGLFSHGGAGKTSLAEALLFDTKTISRLGRVEEGNTASDFDPDEVKRRISVSTAVTPVEWKDTKINVLDAPGYADFLGEVLSAMRVIEGAVIVIDASAGVEVGTEQVWRLAEQHGLRRILFVNKMDRENADFRQALDSAREAFGKNIAPLQFPIGRERDFKGIVDLLSGQAMVFHDNHDGGHETVPIPEELKDDCEEYRQALVEAIAEHNEDLMMRYLEDEPISDAELFAELHDCINDGTVIPMLCGAATSNRGIQPLLDTIVEFIPHASERTLKSTDGDEISTAADAPLVAFAFKTLADPHVGRVTYFRVFGGTFKSHSQVQNASKDASERIGQLFFLRGKDHPSTEEVGAGDIGGVSKLASVTTGDTLVDNGRITLPPIAFPGVAYAASVHPKTKSDLDKLSQALSRMSEEDPSLSVSRDPATGETIVGGLGEPHVQIALERMTRRSGVNVELGLPRVAYRETIGASTLAEYKHKKQTGGAGQYGHVFLALEPITDGDFEFASKVVGGTVPKNFFPAVEKGIREALDSGPLAGYPVVKVRATLTDGSYHDVDSNEMAFKIAAKEAFKKGILAAQPTLLEPILKMRVTVPESFMGDVMSDLNVKRAHVNGMEPGANGFTTIEADVPASEIQRYATDLRSLTQGRGSFSTEFLRYQPVPPHLTEQIKAAAASSNGH